MPEQFESIKKQIEELYQGDEGEFRRTMQLEKFVNSCVEMSNRIAADVSNATYTTPMNLNSMEKPKTEHRLNNLKRDLDIIEGVIGELCCIHRESLSRVEDTLNNISGGGRGTKIR